MGSRQEPGRLLTAVALFVCIWDAALSTPWAYQQHYYAAVKPKVPKAAFNNQRQYSVAQTKQALAQPLMWTFPEDPVQAVKPETSTFELKQPLPANTMTEEFLTYSFKLIYQPSPIGSTPVIRTSQTVVDIECYYTRRNNLSSSALKPSWLSFADSKVAEENLYFSLRLMTDNWQLMRKSSHYFLGERIHVEAGVLPYLRVFVDHCVATLTPDRNTEPRYTFIENYGCLVDAVLTDSTSQFLPRSQDHMLQFYLEAFRFKPQNTSSGSNRKTGQDVDRIYITCHLKATAASSPSDAQHKACSFVDVWRAVDGDDEVCSCCDSSCTTRTARDVSIDTDVQWEADAVLGPIYIH
ncbi:zona pellucida sperm-binding protein 3-like isoform X2 [Esox lucius]|uniref:zona pellucida sperm-binding protein 3-like isoform X2 n=1 Tax=Esox lucius TaxID=8010 RepID=UPI0005761EF0|nr:zona pellucida sperm-binding protein 3-like isoform X2 [Esox lucius]